MPLILNIDTAVQSASVCLADGENVIEEMINPSERESASWLHVAMKELLVKHAVQPQQLQAIAISAGPGSYTGLRVGMSAAKGLCYALTIPLITINTLQLMAASAGRTSTDLLCPMIDARRMEVFTALYNSALEEVKSPTNLILEPDSFKDWLEKYSICFLGNGSEKARSVIKHENALFASVKTTAAHMAPLSSFHFTAAHFADLAYAEPYYGKDFHSTVSKKIY